MTETSTPSCCTDVFNALGVYSTQSADSLNVVQPDAATNAIIQGESLIMEQANRAALMLILTDKCRCECCAGAAAAIPQFYLSALSQASYAGQNSVYSTTLGLTIPANVVTVPAQPTLVGYVNVAASLAAWKVANPTATPAQIAAQQVLILAYRSPLQVFIEDVLLVQAAAQTATVVNYATCADSSSTCPQQTCFVANKCDTSSSTTCPPKVIKVCKPSKPHKETKPCPKKDTKPCKTGTCGKK